LQNFEAIREKIRQSVNLVDVVSEHVTLKRSGRNFTGRCPFHDDKTPSFTVTPEKGFFKCFGCGAGGDVFKFVQLYERVDFMDALRTLADRTGIRIEAEQPTGPSGAARADLAKLNVWAAGVYSRELRSGQRSERAWAFLDGKSLSRETVDRFGLGLALPEGTQLLRAAAAASIGVDSLIAAGLVGVGERGDHYDVFRDRVMFPIRDAMNRVIGFGGRALGEARAKYINTSQNSLYDKGMSVFGLDLARKAISEARSAVLVEGYTDCMAAHQHGVVNTVATLGTALTDGQVNLIRRYCDEILVVFDSDAAGEAAAERAIAATLQSGLRVRLASVPQGKDPCDYLQLVGGEEFRRVLNSAEDALGFKWRHTLDRFQAKGPGRDRRAAMLDFVRFVADLGRAGALDPIDRGIMVSEIARTAGASVEEVHSLVIRSGRPPGSHRGGGETAARGHAVSDEQPVPEDAEQAALSTILEVLLNEPRMWSTVREVFDPDRLRDPVVRRIGQRVREAAEKTDGLEVARLLSGIESTEESARLVDLMFRGEARGDYELTANSAVARIDQVVAARAAKTAARDLHDGHGTEEDLREVGRSHAQLAGKQQFASRRRVADEYGAAPEN